LYSLLASLGLFLCVCCKFQVKNDKNDETTENCCSFSDGVSISRSVERYVAQK